MIEKIGTVLGVFTAPVGFKGFPRPEAEKLELKEGHGIEGDKFAGHDLNKTVLIVGRDAYDLAKEEGIDLNPGSFGENILLDFDPHKLRIGSVIQVGKAEIRIMERCTVCSHLSVFDPKLPELVKDRRGLYCKIINSGEVAPHANVHRIYTHQEILERDSESQKLYGCSLQFPDHFMRLKSLLFMKEFENDEALEGQLVKLEDSENPFDALDDFAEYPDFLLTGYLRTANGNITHMRGVAGEIELTFPASNSSFLQLVSERIRSFAEGSIYLCCAVDMLEISAEKSTLQQKLPEIEQEEPSESETAENAMMDEKEWSIYQRSFEDGEYSSAVCNMGIFVIFKEKQLAKILGFYP